MNRIKLVLAAVAVGVAGLLSTAGTGLAAETGTAQVRTKAGTQDFGALAYYTWRNERSGWCLDQNWSGGVKGHTALAYNCNGATNQNWQLERQSDGTYFVRNQRSGECLHQAYNGSTAQQIVQVWTCSGVSNQRWRVTSYTDGTFSFQNARSGWYLDQSYSGGVPRQNVLAYPFNGGANQYWY